MATDESDRPKSGNPAVSPAALLLAEIERLKADLVQAEWKIAELEARADVDPLLDILNRRGFDRELARSLAYVKRYGATAALMFIDLGRLQGRSSDRHGHAAGDALLKAVAQQLTNNVRASDMVARLGGDEFAVLMWNVTEPHAIAKAHELESAIATAAGSYSGARLSVGASAGIVMLSESATAAEVTEAADMAMYARKKEKRG